MQFFEDFYGLFSRILTCENVSEDGEIKKSKDVPKKNTKRRQMTMEGTLRLGKILGQEG